MSFIFALSAIAFGPRFDPRVEVQVGLFPIGISDDQVHHRALVYSEDRFVLPIVVRNRSHRDLDFYTARTSWGDRAVTVILTDPTGVPHEFTGGAAGYSANAPVFVRVGPGEAWGRDLLLDQVVWSELRNFVSRQTKLNDWKIKVRISQSESGHRDDKSLWVGVAESKTLRIDLQLQ